MKNKTLIAVSAFISLFVITSGIGLIARIPHQSNTAVTSTSSDAALYAQRELAYQQLIDQANQEIQNANQQIATLSNGGTVTPTLETPVFPISADQASTIGSRLVGTTPENVPDLVNYNGTPAYELVYGSGNVYIDASTGEVLYNGIPAKRSTINSQQALQVAMNYLTSSYPVEIYGSYFNGEPVYVIAFADGESVYVDVYGNVVAVKMPSTSSGSSFSGDDDSSQEESSSEIDD